MAGLVNDQSKNAGLTFCQFQIQRGESLLVFTFSLCWFLLVFPVELAF